MDNQMWYWTGKVRRQMTASRMKDKMGLKWRVNIFKCRDSPNAFLRLEVGVKTSLDISLLARSMNHPAPKMIKSGAF